MYVNLILWRIGLFFFWGGGGWRSRINFKNLGSKGKLHVAGAEDFSFRDFGRSMHYFQGSREHKPPRWPHKCLLQWYFNVILCGNKRAFKRKDPG